jgi:ribosomal protein S18 acetylase RimI-like enzyme
MRKDGWVNSGKSGEKYQSLAGWYQAKWGIMKTGTVQLGNASLHIGYSQVIPPTKRGLAREITEFHVPERFRGNGEGTALMNEICGQADQEGIVLLLLADNTRLEAYYKRLGFDTIQADNDILMVRPPKAC